MVEPDLETGRRGGCRVGPEKRSLEVVSTWGRGWGSRWKRLCSGPRELNCVHVARREGLEMKR